MAQIKIYGIEKQLNLIKRELSDAIHRCIVEALAFPENKRSHRFIPLAEEDIYCPVGRTHDYIIIEIMMMEGRKTETKKRLIRLLYERIRKEVRLSASDIEMCILEQPAYHFGFRGMTGDEMLMDYKVEV
ncbi:MAG: tautomerase family protein [Campylobacterales bacterium]|nr:tautomerase family protein [Campylobacterales bacterium]